MDVISGLKQAGVTQISIGVQTFDEKVLFNSLNRRTKKEDLIKTIRAVMDGGFEYVNLDLMFSLEDQTAESVLDDLGTAVELGVDGIFDLSIDVTTIHPPIEEIGAERSRWCLVTGPEDRTGTISRR